MCRIVKRSSLTLTALIVLAFPLRAWVAAADSDEKKPAVVVVRLPAEAELTIAGVKSQQSTGVREFDTPPLTPGRKYSYAVKAVWKDGAKEVTRETTIIVKAGETTEIDLLALKRSPPAEKIPPPELMRTEETKPASKPEPEKKTEPKPEPEKKPELKPEPEKKAELEKKPEVKPEPIKKAETEAEPEKKPEPKPERIKKKPVPKSETSKPPEPVKSIPEAPTTKGTLALVMPDTLTVQPGGTKLLPIKVVRTQCSGSVRVTFEGLPPGMEMSGATVAAEKQKVYVKTAAPADAAEKEWEVKVIGTLGSVRQESPLKIKITK